MNLKHYIPSACDSIKIFTFSNFFPLYHNEIDVRPNEDEEVVRHDEKFSNNSLKTALTK